MFRPFLSLERNTDKKNIILMSTRCLRSAAPSSSVNGQSRRRQRCLAFLAQSKGPAWGPQEISPTSRGADFCRVSVPKRLRAGAGEGERGGLAAVGKDVTVWHFCCCRNEWRGLGARLINCFGLWRCLVRPEPVEKGRWDGERGGGMEKGRLWGHDKGGKRGEEKGKGKQRSEPPRMAAGCYGLEELHLRAFARPEVHGVAHQVHSFEGAHWTTGRRGKDATGGLAVSSCQQERISRLGGRGTEQIFCCRLLALMRGVARRLCTSLDFAKPTDL